MSEKLIFKNFIRVQKSVKIDTRRDNFKKYLELRFCQKK